MNALNYFVVSAIPYWIFPLDAPFFRESHTDSTTSFIRILDRVKTAPDFKIFINLPEMNFLLHIFRSKEFQIKNRNNLNNI